MLLLHTVQPIAAPVGMLLFHQGTFQQILQFDLSHLYPLYVPDEDVLDVFCSSNQPSLSISITAGPVGGLFGSAAARFSPSTLKHTSCCSSEMRWEKAWVICEKELELLFSSCCRSMVDADVRTSMLAAATKSNYHL